MRLLKILKCRIKMEMNLQSNLFNNRLIYLMINANVPGGASNGINKVGETHRRKTVVKDSR